MCCLRRLVKMEEKEKATRRTERREQEGLCGIMKKWRRWLAGVLVAGMLIALLPTAALAENLEGNGAAASTVQEQQDEPAGSGAAKQEPAGETDSAAPAAPSGDTSAGEDPEPVEDTPSAPVSPANPGTGTAPSEAAAQVQAMIDALPGPESALADETAFAAASDAVAGVESAMSALTEAERQTLQLDHYNSLVQALREYVPTVLDEGSPAVNSYYPEGGVAVQKIWNDNNDAQKRPDNDAFFAGLQLWYSLTDESGASGVLSDGAFATSEQPAPLTNEVLSAMGAQGKTVPTASDVKVTETMVNGMKTVTYSVPANTLPSSVTIEGKTYTVQYSVSEPSTVAGYLPAESDGSLTLKNTLATEITATVEWKDNDNYYGTRPDPSTYCSKLKLYRQVGTGTPVEVTGETGVELTVKAEGDSYQISAAGLPAYDPNGQPYTYYFELPKDDRETQTQEISQNNQTLDAGEGNPGGLYDSVITNEGNYANETGYLYPGGKAVHTLTNFFYFQVSKKWVDGDAENRPASILHIYRIAENTSDSAGHGSVVMGGNVVMSPREQYAAGQAGVIQDGNGNTIGHIQRGSDGNEQITDPTGAPVGAWYDDGTVRYIDGRIIGTLNANGELVGALSGHVIGELHSASDKKIGPTEAYSGHIKFFNSTTPDFEVIRIVSGSLLEGSPAEGYDNVAMPRSEEEADAGGEAVTYDSASDTYTVYVGKNGETGELPMYDAQGRRYIYYAVEVMANRGDYVSEAENPTTYRPDTLVAAGDDYVLNGGTLTNRLSSPVTVEATKVFEANAIQEMPETKVTMALQKRAAGTEDPWEFVLEDRVPLNRDGAPVTDENQNPLYEAVTDANGVTKYRHVLTLTGFQSEDLSQSGSLVVDRYDEDGHELEYRWVETAVSMQEANSPIEVKNPDGYYDTGDVITLNPEDPKDNIVPGVGANRTTAQFRVEVDSETGTVTNTLVGNTQVKLVKAWRNVDGTIMTEEQAKKLGLSTTATFTLYQDGKPMNDPGATVTLDLAKGADQNHIWTELPRYDENGLEHEYTVVEEPSKGWSSDLVYSKEVVQGDGVDGKTVALTQTNASIVNQPIGDSIIIDVQKQWLDNGDLNCRRPVKITLYDRATGLPVADASISNFAAAGGATRTLDASGNWTTRYILSGEAAKGKTASDFIALETALVVDENISIPVDYYNVRDGITNIETLIAYLTDQNADGVTRLSRLTSTADFAIGEKNIDQMIDLLAGHLGYSGENAEFAPHYYNVYVGQREDHNDRYACYLLFNQRTGVVYLDAEKTWVDGGDGLPIELGIYRTQKGVTDQLETVSLDPQTGGTPTMKDENIVGYTMTWDSEQEDHKNQPGYGAVLLKPDTGYPKYDFLGRLLEYSIREVQIGNTQLNGDENTVEITNGDVTDTYTVTTTAHPPEYGASRHSGDRYSYSITNQKQETYTLSVNKVWQDDGTQSNIGHQNLQSRPDPVYTIYRTTAYTGEELQGLLNNGEITQEELLEQSEAITGTMIWNTQHNNWYWGTDRLDSVDRYDSNGRPYVYFLIEKMRANGDGNYSTFYYNANQDDNVDGIDFAPSDTVTEETAKSLVEEGYLKDNGNGTYTDAYGNLVTVGEAPTSTSQVFAPTRDSEMTSSVALIISDGQHKGTNGGSYSDYWSCTTVNYCEGVRDLSGKKIWSGLPNTGNLLPSEYLPELTMSLWQTNKAPVLNPTREDLTPVMENGTQRTTTATAKDNFAFSFGELSRYDQYGQRIYYYVTEAYVAPAAGGYGETDISTLPHFDFTFRNVYDGKPSTALTIEKSWPDFDPDGMYEVDGIDRELPQTTTFKLESFMPDVKGYDAPGCHIEEYDCYIQLTVSYPGTGGYDVTAKIVDADGTEIDDITVKAEKAEGDACKWTIQVDGLRGYAPNGQKMVYRVTESGKAEGYTVTAELSADSPQLVLGENAAQTTGLLETIGDLFVRAFNGLRALFTAAEEPETGDPTPSAGTAFYTNTYQGETVDYTVTKAWQGDQKNNWDETDRRESVTVVLCRQWWSDAQGKMLNEVMLNTDGTPRTAELKEDTGYQTFFVGLTRYAPNGNPYRYYVIEHPEEARSYTPATTQAITFENVSRDRPLTYTSSNTRLNPVMIGEVEKWAVSGNYSAAQTKPTADPAKNDTLTNKLPLTSVRLEKRWQTEKNGETAPLTEEDYEILKALGAFPTMLYVDVEKWNGSEWVSYAPDLGHFTLSASTNYSEIVWTFSDSLPKYEDGCNGTDHDGCTDTNGDDTIDHKVAQYRLVERLVYADKTEVTFPNGDTKKQGEPTDPYNSEPGVTGVGTIGNFDSTVVRTVNSDGTTVNTFTNTIPLRPLRVDKIWVDNTNKDGTRPVSLTINLYRDVTGNITTDENGNATGWTGLAGEYDLRLGYVDAVDDAENHWAKLVYVPLYQNGYSTGNKQYSSYMVTEAGFLNTLIKSDGITPVNGTIQLPPSQYELTDRAAQHTTVDGTRCGVNDYAGLQTDDTNNNYFLFTNTLRETERVPLEATKAFANDSGWDTLTRPIVEFTLEYYNREAGKWFPASGTSTYTVTGSDGTSQTVSVDASMIVGELKRLETASDGTKTWPEATASQTILIDGNTGSFTWQANRYYPKTQASVPREEIQYRVVETMKNASGEELTIVAPYTGMTVDGGTWEKPTSTITNTLRTVPLNLTKTWAGDTEFAAALRPDSVTYLVEYRRAAVTVDENGHITVGAWIAEDWTPAQIGTPGENGVYPGTITLDTSNTTQNDNTWILKQAVDLPLFDKNGNLFVYRVSEYSMTYGSGGNAVTYTAVKTGNGFTTSPTDRLTSTWDGTVGGYTGHVVTAPTLGADGLPTGWYAGGGTDNSSANTNTFETTGLTVEKKVAADNYAAATFDFTVTVDLNGCAPERDSYAWTVVCQNAGHGVEHEHAAQHGEAQVAVGENGQKTLTINVQLGHGDRLYVHYLPAGAKYTVTETQPDGMAYDTMFKVNGIEQTTQGTDSASAAGTMKADTAEAVLCINRLASLAVVKVDGGGSPLAGAGFTLYDSADNAVGSEVQTSLMQKIYLAKDVSGNLSYEGYDPDTGRVYVAADQPEYTVHKESGTAAGTSSYFYYKPLGSPLTDAQNREYLSTGTVDGVPVAAVAEFRNLPVGTYTLKETSVPDGYIRLKEVEDVYPVILPQDGVYNAGCEVINYKGMALPTTGHGGVLGVVAMGLTVFALGSALLLYLCRLKPVEQTVSSRRTGKKKKGGKS